MKLPLISGWVARTLTYGKKHKIISAIAIIVVLGVGFWGYQKLTAPKAASMYTVGSVTKGTIIESVSASGQVANVNTVSIKPKASGDITWVGVAAGQTVRAGQAIAAIDNTDAKQAVADAQQSLAQAQLQFQKDSAQAPIDYASAERTLADAKTKLDTTYNDVFTTVSNAYLDLPAVVTGAENALYGYDLSPSKTQWNADTIKAYFVADETTYESIGTYVTRAESDYATARPKYDASLAEYKVLTRYSASSDLEQSLNDSVDTAKAVSQALQSELNLLDAATDAANNRGMTLNPKVATLRTTVQGYLATANSTLSSLLSEQSTLESAKQAVQTDTDSVNILSIGNNATGSNPISLQSSAYSLEGQKRSLQNLQDALSDYTIVAPFSGTLSSVDISRGDTVSTGTSVATLVSSDQVAQLSLNEVDAAKIALGDKVTLTFDAIDGLSLTGKVASIDTVGTVSQGVVSYTVKISFDTQDARVKSGMTVNAEIETNVAQDALMVPSGAVKTGANGSYVLVFKDNTLSNGTTVPAAGAQVTQEIVTTGISDDTNIQILSGLSEGQKVVARSATTGGTSSGATTGTGGVGGVRTGGGNAIRFGGFGG